MSSFTAKPLRLLSIQVLLALIGCSHGYTPQLVLSAVSRMTSAGRRGQSARHFLAATSDEPVPSTETSGEPTRSHGPNPIASRPIATTSTHCSRRGSFNLVGAAFSSAAVWVVVSGRQEPSYAFDNKISDKYDDRPKQRGPKPRDLGVATRTTLEGDEVEGLKFCGAAPNCFSSSIPETDDPDHSIPAWKWPPALSRQDAFDELYAVLQQYPPGQNNVDGGGFQIQTFDKSKGYIYVQYEALKNGYIDDVEFAYIPESSNDAIQVRSSSRIGYLDFGVNAKRLNWIAQALRQKGWDAVGVDYKTHQNYAYENRID